MKKLILSLTFAASCAFAQLGSQSLEQIKIAADAGDPVAQDKLASHDPANAEMWYRKAVAQGSAHSEGQLTDENVRPVCRPGQPACEP